MSLELKQELEHWQARAVAAESVLANIAEVRATWSKSSEWEERDSATDRALGEASGLAAAVAKVAESKELHQWAIENHVSLWWNTATISNGPWWWRKWNAERWNGRFMTAEEAIKAAKEAE